MNLTRYLPLSAEHAKAPHTPLYSVTYMVPGGRTYYAVTDDHGALVEIDKFAALYSMYSLTIPTKH